MNTTRPRWLNVKCSGKAATSRSNKARGGDDMPHDFVGVPGSGSNCVCRDCGMRVRRRDMLDHDSYWEAKGIAHG